MLQVIINDDSCKRKNKKENISLPFRRFVCMSGAYTRYGSVCTYGCLFISCIRITCGCGDVSSFQYTYDVSDFFHHLLCWLQAATQFKRSTSRHEAQQRGEKVFAVHLLCSILQTFYTSADVKVTFP